MKKAKLIMILAVVSAIAMTCGCKGSKKDTESSATVSETTASVSEESSSESDETSSMQEDSTSESSESATEPSSQEPVAIKTAKEMEEAFLEACKDSIEPVTERDAGEKNTVRVYGTKSVHILFRVYSDAESAKAAVQETLDYGGWYEEDLVVKEIKKEEGTFFLEAYYCKIPEGSDALFVLGYNDTISFSMEALDTDHVKNVENILLAMGIDLKTM